MHHQIFAEYRQLLESDPDRFFADYQNIRRKLHESNAKYKGKIINFCYQPVFFDKSDIINFESICSMMMRIITKCTNEYIRNPSFREFFGYSRKMEELILIDPGYNYAAPVARLDIFYDEDFKFCELNGDGTSAMNEANTLERIFMESEIIGELQKKYKIRYHELFASWLQELLAIYREFGGTKKPQIAIVDFLELGSTEEFDTFQAVFQNHGYKNVICDPREMIYKQGKLYFGELAIDLVYRRAVNQEVEKRLDEIPDFIQAYKDRAVCVVGPFRSQIMHNKIFFSILSDSEKVPFLNETERSFIDEHIPKTWQMIDAPKQKVLTDKDCYLIKPQDLYGGKEVVCGLDCTEHKWQQIIQNAQEKRDYLLQEFCNFTEREIPVYENCKFIFGKYKTTLGLFCYRHKFSGLYSRISRHNVIAGVENSISLPSFVVE